MAEVEVDGLAAMAAAMAAAVEVEEAMGEGVEGVADEEEVKWVK